MYEGINNWHLLLELGSLRGHHQEGRGAHRVARVQNRREAGRSQHVVDGRSVVVHAVLVPAANSRSLTLVTLTPPRAALLEQFHRGPADTGSRQGNHSPVILSTKRYQYPCVWPLALHYRSKVWNHPPCNRLCCLNPQEMVKQKCRLGELLPHLSTHQRSTTRSPWLKLVQQKIIIFSL